MLYTPVKAKDQPNLATPTSTLPSTNRKLDQPDFKSKMLELISQNVQLKGKLKTYQSRIEKLEQDASAANQDLTNFYRKSGCTSLSQAYQKMSQLESSSVQVNLSPLKEVALQLKQSLVVSRVNQYANQYYASTINKKLQEISRKYQGKLDNSEKQNAILRKQVSEITEECQNLRRENKKLLEKNQRIKIDLNNSIEKYQSIEIIVENKLKYYIEKIKEYEEQLARSKHEKLEFSFARDEVQQSKASQLPPIHTEPGQKGQATEAEENAKSSDPNQNELMSAECYRASIEGLLEENRRLKKSFHSLYRLKQGEPVPPQLQKEINIMHSILELNENTQEINF